MTPVVRTALLGAPHKTDLGLGGASVPLVLPRENDRRRKRDARATEVLLGILIKNLS